MTEHAFAAVLVALAAMASALAVGLVRHYAMRAEIIDRPNERSSHARPVPRGGGLGVIVVLLATFLGAVLLAGLDSPLAMTLPLLGIGIVAAAGWFDDRNGASVRGRLLAHAVAATTLLPLALEPTPAPVWMGWWAAGWWMLWTVSAINVVNFMDGIDGLIGSQTVVFGLHLWVLGDFSTGGAALLGGALTGSCAGFLLWNWAPARIFLGDVGSGALGMAVAFGSMLLVRHHGIGVVAACLPLAPLFLDATATLTRRALQGEPVTQAHRSHLYQRLANQGGWTHAAVSVLYGGVAGIGVIVSQAHAAAAFIALAGAYVLAVVALGVWLDRRVPPVGARHPAAAVAEL